MTKPTVSKHWRKPVGCVYNGEAESWTTNKLNNLQFNIEKYGILSTVWPCGLWMLLFHVMGRVNLLSDAWASRYNSVICCSKMSIFGHFVAANSWVVGYLPAQVNAALNSIRSAKPSRCLSIGASCINECYKSSPM